MSRIILIPQAHKNTTQRVSQTKEKSLLNSSNLMDNKAKSQNLAIRNHLNKTFHLALSLIPSNNKIIYHMVTPKASK